MSRLYKVSNLIRLETLHNLFTTYQNQIQPFYNLFPLSKSCSTKKSVQHLAPSIQHQASHLILIFAKLHPASSNQHEPPPILTLQRRQRKHLRRQQPLGCRQKRMGCGACCYGRLDQITRWWLFI